MVAAHHVPNNYLSNWHDTYTRGQDLACQYNDLFFLFFCLLETFCMDTTLSYLWFGHNSNLKEFFGRDSLRASPLVSPHFSGHYSIEFSRFKPVCGHHFILSRLPSHFTNVNSRKVKRKSPLYFATTISRFFYHIQLLVNTKHTLFHSIHYRNCMVLPPLLFH